MLVATGTKTFLPFFSLIFAHDECRFSPLFSRLLQEISQFSSQQQISLIHRFYTKIFNTTAAQISTWRRSDQTIEYVHEGQGGNSLMTGHFVLQFYAGLGSLGSIDKVHTHNNLRFFTLLYTFGLTTFLFIVYILSECQPDE